MSTDTPTVPGTELITLAQVEDVLLHGGNIETVSEEQAIEEKRPGASGSAIGPFLLPEFCASPETVPESRVTNVYSGSER